MNELSATYGHSRTSAPIAASVTAMTFAFTDE